MWSFLQAVLVFFVFIVAGSIDAGGNVFVFPMRPQIYICAVGVLWLLFALVNCGRVITYRHKEAEAQWQKAHTKVNGASIYREKKKPCSDWPLEEQQDIGPRASHVLAPSKELT